MARTSIHMHPSQSATQIYIEFHNMSCATRCWQAPLAYLDEPLWEKLQFGIRQTFGRQFSLDFFDEQHLRLQRGLLCYWLCSEHELGWFVQSRRLELQGIFGINDIPQSLRLRSRSLPDHERSAKSTARTHPQVHRARSCSRRPSTSKRDQAGIYQASGEGRRPEDFPNFLCVACSRTHEDIWPCYAAECGYGGHGCRAAATHQHGLASSEVRDSTTLLPKPKDRGPASSSRSNASTP